MIGELATAFKLAKGYRLHPWDSPYLRWRMETWSGIDAHTIDRPLFLKFVWTYRTELWRYLNWVARKGG